MQKNVIISSITLLFVFCSLTVSAQEDDKRVHHKGNFSGMIQTGGVWVNSDSQLETESENAKTDSLYDTADAHNIISPFILIEANYVLPTGTGFYIKTPFETGYGLSAGILKKTSIGFFDASGFYGLDGSVWEDPYLVNTVRHETDMEVIGCDLEFKRVIGTSLDLNYKFRNYDVDKDSIGELFDDLRRDGAAHEIGFRYGFEFDSGNRIQPGLNYLLKKMDGESQSCSGFAGELSFIRMAPTYMMSLKIGGGLKNYDKTHPLYKTKRKDREYCIMGMIAWINPFGMKRFILNTGVGYNTTDSNIQFIDSHSMFTLMTVGYQFGAGGH